MLYRTCKRMIEKGNTAGMATKLDVFYAANKLTEDEYNVNIPYGTALTCQDGFLMHKNQRVCAVGSQNGMDCFVQDDDGNGTLRGELVGNIQRCLERRDADYQTRWNRVWASALCQKYRRPESEDYWLWARAFFDAPIFDLQAIAALVQ